MLLDIPHLEQRYKLPTHSEPVHTIDMFGFESLSFAETELCWLLK